MAEEEETEAEQIEESSNPIEEAATPSSNKKKLKFEIEAPLPLEYRHVRHSERIICDEVYETLANLV